jgi:DNA modification methylase
MYDDFYQDHLNVQLHNVGSEYIDLKKDTIDFAFTSPPYFNTEKYALEETQSFIKFPTKELWLNEFIGKTFDNTYACLTKNGKMAINIANVKNYPDLCEDIISIAKKTGFYLEDTLKLSLSNSTFKTGKDAFKYEPIFIFSKIS